MSTVAKAASALSMMLCPLMFGGVCLAQTAAEPAQSASAASAKLPVILSYGQRIRYAILRHIHVSGGRLDDADMLANPAAEVEVRTEPDGRIASARLAQSSGVVDWDAAVLRAVEKAGAIPHDVDGRVPPVLMLTFRPR